MIESPAANALSVGRNPSNASIAITRGLLEKLDREELQGVIAHELAHIANLDSRHAVLVALLVGAIVLLTDVFLRLIIEIAKNPLDGRRHPDTVAALALWLVVVVVGLIVGGLLRLLAPLAALAVQAAVSRDREYLADATAVGITRNTAGLIGALEKLERTRAEMKDANRGTQHLWIVNPVQGGQGGRTRLVRHPPGHLGPHRAPAGAGRAGRRRDAARSLATSRRATVHDMSERTGSSGPSARRPASGSRDPRPAARPARRKPRRHPHDAC